MKKVLEKIWKFLNSRIVLYAAIVVAAILFVGTCSRNGNLKDKINRKDQNISALTDSVQTVTLKNGDLQSSRDAYMATAKELREYNKDLSDQIKAQDGRIVTLSNIVFQLKQDTAALREYIRNLPDPEPPLQENDSTWKVSWALRYDYDSTNYDIYKGNTRIGLRGPLDLSQVSVFHKGTELTFRESQISLTWGQKWEGTGKNKRLKVYAQTAHPAFQTKLLEGTYVDYPTKKHWFTGFGVGPQLGLGYDPFGQKPALYLGFGIHYNIYQF
jgi:hypothetical protein